LYVEEKPATFINRPLSRAQLRKKFIRKLKKSDITWRNTALLCKFMNETGKILNRYQSRLESSVHRKVAKTIKKVRDLDIFSHVGLVKPTDRIPVGSYIEDLEEMHKKTIDPITGRMFLKHSLQDELPVKEKRVFDKLEERFAGVESKDVFDEDL
jgi:ribosomal protein S18